MGSMPYKSHGEKGIAGCKVLQKAEIGSFSIREHTQPYLFMRLPEGKPFVELFGSDTESFTELLHGKETGKIFSKDAQNEEETVVAVRDNDIGQDGMCMVAAVAEYPENTQVIFDSLSAIKVDNGSSIVVMDMAVTGTSTNRAGFQMWLKESHVGIKKRF